MTNSKTPTRFALVPVLLIQLLGTNAIANDVSSDKPRAAWTTSRINGAPYPPAPYRIVPAFSNLKFDRPTCALEIAGAARLLVGEQHGKIFSFSKRSNVAKPDLVIDLAKSPAPGSVSLWHMALHPRFDQNRYLFVCYVRDGQTRVSRFTLAQDQPPRAAEDSERVLIAWPAGGHNAGCLQFGTDGYLYISTGDGSGPNPPDGRTAAQDVTNLFGAILRIDVDMAENNRNYRIPPDNPFIDLDGARPEIWAYGLRNPWKFGIDRTTGDLFAADNGWESWEMVHRIERGGNCGWPIMEGRVPLRSDVQRGPTEIIPPVKDHPHTEANSVIGGPVYRGGKLPGLKGAFIYGDYITGTIWALRPDDDNAYSSTTLVDTDQRIVAFAEGSEGEIYVVDFDFTGQIYELLPANVRGNSADFPRRLSETGLFTSLDDMQPAPGVVPYEVCAERWADGANAQRWVAVPNDGLIQLPTDKQPAAYPNGTVFVKHLSLPIPASNEPVRLETQILHFENGHWNPYSYLWDETGKDALLVDSAGSNRVLRWSPASASNTIRERTWHASATNECRLCHNAGSHFVLGFVRNQLTQPSDDGHTSQLASLVDQCVVAAVRQTPIDDSQRLADPHDDSQSLDDRARSYLHVNCSMCHHKGGNAIVSFFLRRDMPFSELNANKGTGIGTFGMQNAKIIVPGDPFRSLLLYRMSKLGYGRMPYIGSQVIDSDGVALVAEWISKMSDVPVSDASAPVKTESLEHVALLSLATNADVAANDQALGRLVNSTEGALALVALIHGGKLRDQITDSGVAMGYKSPSTDIRGLFETFIPESTRRVTLGPNIDPNSILSLSGDIGRGKLIFFSDASRCRACHDTDDAAKSTGPTLANINKKYPHRSELLQHVLQPSLKIDEGFASWQVSTKDGKTTTGLLANEQDDVIVIKTAQQKLVRIPRDEIDAMKKSQQSLMPERVLSDLTPQEATDLLMYIRSIAPPADRVEAESEVLKDS